MMWTELLTKRELQSTKKIGCNIYTATLRAVFKKISKVHSFHFPYAMFNNHRKQSASLYTGEEDMKGMVSLQIIDTELQSADLK